MTWAFEHANGVRVSVRALMSRLVLSLAMLCNCGTATGHEVQPAIADIVVTDEQVTIDIEIALEAPLVGIDLEGLTDTNESELADAYDAMRALGPAELEAKLREGWPRLRTLIVLRAGDTALTPDLGTVTVPEVGDITWVRPSIIQLVAPLPDDGTPVVFGWHPSLGALVLRQQGVDDGYTGYLIGGALSDPIPRGAGGARAAADVALAYVVAGFDHIIPKGLDHILFVLGLFFFALKWGPILWQVTAFTVAHTITLGLATLGIITIPDSSMWLVEALIALSIVYVAVENVLRPEMGWVRPAVVFGFGLLHGLGFASVLGDFGLPAGQFLLALLSFNVGVELGQLAVILLGFLAVILARGLADVADLDDEEALVRDLPVIYRGVSLVGSLVIAVIGAYWFVERIGLLP
ncbi:MAG: HupE/UreJ family protein [Pseudomonadota bacterium]